MHCKYCDCEDMTLIDLREFNGNGLFYVCLACGYRYYLESPKK